VNGNGNGDGCGCGYGYGDGNGCGYGDGDGNGCGDGYGYGYGYGDGYGDGYGSGSGYEKNAQNYFDQLVSAFRPQEGERLCFWNSTEDGLPANGGDGGPVAVGAVQRVEGPLKLCGPGALHGTMLPTKWNGNRTWVVALKEPVIEEGDKLGSLERRIVADLGCCGLCKS